MRLTSPHASLFDNRRESIRVDPGGEATVGMNGRTYTARILNLGTGGLLLDTSNIDERFYQGEELSIAFTFEAVGTVACKAEVRWSTPVARVAGVRLRGLSSEQKTSLRHFVTRLGASRQVA